ncbi:MAG TPA: outer membrane lipid asymmetry maintenance protein MlaD [Alphaproteobacteria bacterium]|nr:outer membrane lipid asymmetry maintenance protein MlaD [Alphaproteobacteria bacterium]
MGRNAIETVMGAVVLVVAGFFVFFAMSTAQVKAVRGYEVKAPFYKIGGLKQGADVRISGIKVGSVIKRFLDPKTYDAVVLMVIRPDVKLPTDTVASIASEGMLGDKYLRLVPGREKTMVADGGVLSKTSDFRSLEDQVGEIIFLATGGSGSK